MANESLDFAWKLTVQLRTEMMEAQRIRTQIIGLKLTSVSAGIGLILANVNLIPSYVLVIPALAAVLFDLLVIHYNNSITSLHHYYLRHVHARLRGSLEEPVLEWETYMPRRRAGPVGNLMGIANLGISVLAAVPAIISLLMPFDAALSLPLLLIVTLFYVCDTWLHLNSYRYVFGLREDR
jgi:hypothetical protein